MKTYFELATDPLQYDSEEMDWKKEGLSGSPSRLPPQRYLDQEMDIKGKDVADIGCGMGQLFPLLKAKGAKSITGIEPSKNSVAVCKELYPDVPVIQADLERIDQAEGSAGPVGPFDAAVSVFVFEHIKDAEAGLRKIRKLLKSGGMLYFIHSDMDYFLTPRFDYGIDSQRVDEHTVAVKTKRSAGVMHDVVHPAPFYTETAAKAGFAVEKRVEMIVTDDYIAASPKYAPFAGKTIAHLLILKAV